MSGSISGLIITSQLIHPLVSTEAEKCDRRFEDLVGLGHEYHPDDRELPPERAEEGERHNDGPGTDHIGIEREFCISAPRGGCRS